MYMKSLTQKFTEIFYFSFKINISLNGFINLFVFKKWKIPV